MKSLVRAKEYGSPYSFLEMAAYEAVLGLAVLDAEGGKPKNIGKRAELLGALTGRNLASSTRRLQNGLALRGLGRLSDSVGIHEDARKALEVAEFVFNQHRRDRLKKNKVSGASQKQSSKLLIKAARS